MEKNKIAVVVGYNLRKYLNSRGLSSKWLSAESGIEHSQLKKYLSGYLTMGIDKVPKICNALNMYPDFLFLGTTEDFLETFYQEAINYRKEDE